jgi:hypothetical protein
MTGGAAVNRELQYHVLRFGADLPDGIAECRLCHRRMTLLEWARVSECPGAPVKESDSQEAQERAALKAGTKALEVDE